MKCSHCGKETNISRISYLSTQELCNECFEKEKLHPLYEIGRKVERLEIKKGNYNYKGILEVYKGSNEEIINAIKNDYNI